MVWQSAETGWCQRSQALGTEHSIQSGVVKARRPRVHQVKTVLETTKKTEKQSNWEPVGGKRACRQTLLRKPLKINSGGPKAKKKAVINISVFLLPTKRRKPPALPSHPSQQETQDTDDSLYHPPSPDCSRAPWGLGNCLKGKRSSQEMW